MQKVELSVIIPMYNAEKYIERCIKSILKSKEDEVEIIAVDDGSKDHSLEICKKLAAEHSNVHVYSKENGGVSSARNFGLDVAKGRYITFCDADDYYEAMAVTEMLKIIGGGTN